MLSSLALRLRYLRPDWFVVSLVGTVLLAALVPCSGTVAGVFHVLGICAIASLFFLQGARLSRDAVLGGIKHWRLHATTAMTTFVLFPMVGWALNYLFPQLLPPTIWVGVVFLCALPSTVQSSIALISIAQGNIAGAVCSATFSTVAGMVLTPLLLGALAHLQGGRIAMGNIGQVLLELMVPFLCGHLLRPWIGQWATRNRHLLAVTDRGSVLLVVYTAFSAAVITGVWNQLPPAVMAFMVLVVALLLMSGLLATIISPSLLGFDRKDRIAVMFCGSQKSLIIAVPMANVLFPAATVGPVLIPIMIYHPMQLVVGAWLAKRLARPASAGEQIIAVEPKPTTIVEAIAARVPEQAR
jgi:solute carrier family 10 (sodium/bile acid cotransporter), member 7